MREISKHMQTERGTQRNQHLQHLMPEQPAMETICAVFDEETGKFLEYKQLKDHPKYKEVWHKSFANELGRLAQGVRDIEGTNTVKFIRKDQVPEGLSLIHI